jgi:hypothetical protein
MMTPEEVEKLKAVTAKSLRQCLAVVLCYLLAFCALAHKAHKF